MRAVEQIMIFLSGVGINFQIGEKTMKKLALLALSAVFMFGCGSKDSDDESIFDQIREKVSEYADDILDSQDEEAVEEAGPQEETETE